MTKKIACNVRGRFTDAAYFFAKMLREEGVTNPEIAKRLNTSPATVRTWLARKYPPSQAPKRSAPKAVQRRMKARRELVEKLVATKVTIVGKRYTPKRRYVRERKVVRYPYGSSRKIARKITGDKPMLKCSYTTVQRDLRRTRKAYVRRRIPRLTESHIAARVTFAKRLTSPSHVRDTLPRLVFTDEKWFDSEDGGRSWIWLAPGEAPPPREHERFGPRVMVWAAIGVNFRWLERVPAADDGKGSVKINGDVYTSVISRCVKELRARKLILQQDNAPGHVARGTAAWFKQRRVALLDDWPANSPDLNPVETLWAILARRVTERAPFGEEELWQFVKEEFDAIEQSTINGLVMSFERRLRACTKERGKFLTNSTIRAKR